MGADVIGWRDCPLQQDLGVDGFLGKLKLRSYKQAIEERVPEEKWPTIQVRVTVTGRGDRNLAYPEIAKEVEAFQGGIPDCDACPLADGRRLGCYRYVTFPIDAAFEQLVFAFFRGRFREQGTACKELYDVIFPQLAEGEGWYAPRGEAATLAVLKEPLVHAWEEGDGERVVDSAQLLSVLFITLADPKLLELYAAFWAEFFKFVSDVGARLDFEGDRLQLTVDTREQLTESALVPIWAATSKTITEVLQVATALAEVFAHRYDGWSLVVDA